MNNNENIEPIKKSESNALPVKKNNSKKLLVILLIVVLIIVGFVCYKLFMGNNNENQGNNQQINVGDDFTIQKKLQVFAFNVILDTDGNAYLDLREENIAPQDFVEVTELFNNAKTYNYDKTTQKLVKIDLENIKDIQCLEENISGTNYITFLDNNDKLYVLIDYVVQDTGKVTLLTDDKLNNVTKVYNECDGEGCQVMADAIINGQETKVLLYDLFEKSN